MRHRQEPSASFQRQILPMVDQTHVGRHPTRRRSVPSGLTAVVQTTVDRLRQRLERLHGDLGSFQEQLLSGSEHGRLQQFAHEAAVISRTLHHVSDLATPQHGSQQRGSEQAVSQQWVEPHGLLESLLGEMIREARDDGRHLPTFSLDVEERLLMQADPAVVRRVLRTLLSNAIDAAGPDGEVVVTGVQYADAVEIEVADSGEGLSSHARAWLFEPGFTTKPDGTGVALAAARALLDQLGGSIDAINCPEGGTAFTIRLPRQHPLRRMAA